MLPPKKPAMTPPRRRNQPKKRRGPADPTIRAIQNQINQAAQTRNNAQEAAHSLFRRGQGDNEYIAGEVADFLAAQNAKIQSGYNDAGSRMAGANAALAARQTETSGANRNTASAEQSRLGIQGAGLGNFDSDNSFAQLMNQQNANNDQQNNSFAAQNAGSIGNLLLGMNQGQRQSNAGQLRNKHHDDVSGIRNDFRDFQLASLGRIQEYRAERQLQRQREAAARRERAAYSRSGGGYSYSGGGGGYSRGGSGSGSGNDYGVGGLIDLLGTVGNPRNNASKPKPKSYSAPNILNGMLNHLR